MTKAGSFFFMFLVVYCPVLIFAMILVYFLGNIDYLKACIIGSSISIALICATVIVIMKFVGKSIPLLLGVVVGGFLFRLLAVLGSGLIVNYKTDLHIYSFYAGLFGSFFLLLGLEIIFLHNRIK